MQEISNRIRSEIFKAAVESSYDGIHILDKKGKTLYINKACERIEGVSCEEVRRKDIRELVESGVYSESVTLKVLEEDAPVTISQKAKNGNEILVTGTPIYVDGEIDIIVVNSRDITELNHLKRELFEKEELASRYHRELELLRSERIKLNGIISKSTAMEKIISLSLIVAKVDSTVFLHGESGVGKGVLSNFIHMNSIRRNGPFIKIDCSAIPESLFESELFGYETGAFTGAERGGKTGLLELANGGTVFLDEIGEMPLSMQAKLMRSIQDREIVKVGGKQIVPINIRIIAATNRDLEEMVENKTFRKDLFYRLNVVPILIPPLRERPEDIYPLLLEMIRRVNDKYNMNKKISNEAIECMIKYEWPGNIRELENVTERMMVTSDAPVIGKLDVPRTIMSNYNDSRWIAKAFKGTYSQKLREFDKLLITEAIEKEGSVVKAANELGVNVTTIRRKLGKYQENE
ncbi:MAG: sigma 54-interacting transcriptional regulator [Peptostreptococcaceae bacterium]|nr:sigma 54-interacting transcriptional regulator [Peptostreptococcaceae bacterium]